MSFLKLPEEAPEVTDVRPPADWPSTGAIAVKHATLAYRPGLPLVLKGLNLHIEGGEKVGICGRTGAGKSSLGQVCVPRSFCLRSRLPHSTPQIIISDVPFRVFS